MYKLILLSLVVGSYVFAGVNGQSEQSASKSYDNNEYSFEISSLDEKSEAGRRRGKGQRGRRRGGGALR